MTDTGRVVLDAKAWQEGFTAGRRGVKWNANPYAPGRCLARMVRRVRRRAHETAAISGRMLGGAMFYDASKKPDPQTWLELDESKRIDLVIKARRRRSGPRVRVATEQFY